MELYIGGRAQGKLAYVVQKYPGISVYDETGLVALIKSGACDVPAAVIGNHFHLVVRTLLTQGMEQEQIWELVNRLLEKCPEAVIISDEIGSGIVPMEKEERIWREVTGRILTRIAARAVKVERIVCGIPMVIK